MSVNLISDGEVVGQLATNQGHRDLIAYVRGEREAAPHLWQLLAEAASESVPQLRKETARAAENCDWKSVKSTLENLAALLVRAGKVVVLE